MAAVSGSPRPTVWPAYAAVPIKAPIRTKISNGGHHRRSFGGAQAGSTAV